MCNRYVLGVGVALSIVLSWTDAYAQLPALSGPSAWYFGVEGGWSGLEGSQSGPASSPLVGSLSETFDSGYNIGVRGGYRWGPLRVEEEFRYQHNAITSITDGVPPKTVPASGTRTAYALMTNAIYDFNVGWPVTPHVGGGIGAVGQRDEWTVPAGRCDDAWDWKFGYQAIAGIRYNVTPSVALDVDYRYLATTDPTFVFNGAGAPAPVIGTTFTSGYATHSVVVSLTVLFGGSSGEGPR
jgi:OmpA-OmpF porin, OOP family